MLEVQIGTYRLLYVMTTHKCMFFCEIGLDNIEVEVGNRYHISQ